MDLRGEDPPHVPEMPRLVLVAGLTRAPALGVAHDPAVLPAVPRQPGACLRPAPVDVAPGCRAARRLEVHRGPELVLGMAGPCRSQPRAGIPHLPDPAPERAALVRIAAVGGLHSEPRTGDARRAVHRREVCQGDAPNPPRPRRSRPGDAHEVRRHVARGETEPRVEHAAVPVGRRPVAAERVAHRAGCGLQCLRGRGRLADAQREHGRQHGDQQATVRGGNLHLARTIAPGRAVAMAESACRVRTLGERPMPAAGRASPPPGPRRRR